MPTPDDADLGDILVDLQLAEADFALALLQRIDAVRQSGGGDGEREAALIALAGRALDDHVHVDRRLGQRREDRPDHARFVLKPGQRHHRLVLVDRDARDQLAFHLVLQCVVADDQSARPILETRQDLEREIVAHR
jgi:hypothetical protein